MLATGKVSEYSLWRARRALTGFSLKVSASSQMDSRGEGKPSFLKRPLTVLTFAHPHMNVANGNCYESFESTNQTDLVNA